MAPSVRGERSARPAGAVVTFRRAFSLLDRGTQVRFGATIGLAALTAMLDFIAVLLVLPLSDVLSGEPPSNLVSEWILGILPTADRTSRAFALAGAIGVCFLLKAVLSTSLLWWALTFLAPAEAATSNRLLRLQLAAPWPFQLGRNSAEVLRTVGSSVDGTFGGALGPAMFLLSDGAALTAVTVALFVVDPVAAAVVFVLAFGAAVLYIRLIRGEIAARAAEVQQRIAEVNRYVLQSLGGAKELIVRGREAFYLDRHANAVRRLARARRTVGFLNQINRYYLEVVLVLVLTAVTAVTAGIAGLDDSLATLAVVLVAGFRMLPSLNRILLSVGTIRAAAPAVDIVVGSLESLAAATRSAYSPDGDRILPISTRRVHEVASERFGITPQDVRFERQIRLEGVSFRYPGATQDAVRDVDLSIRRGEIVALVGPTGAGKSTLADIVLGLLEPTTGRVRVDEYDLAQGARPWQRLIGYVPQEIYLADDALAANIAFGVPPEEIDSDQVARALALAQLDSLVSRLPEGLETRVGERGVRLSGGERQRLGLARALYLRPPMLVLDEATSALDNSTEARISSTFRSLHGSVTMLVIAHRLSTVRESDRVVFVDHGRVVGSGPFRELERELPAFAHMVELAALPD